MARRYVKSATYVQDLLYFDGPQLMLLRSNRKLPMLAVAVDRDDMEYGFFACEVREKEFKRYRHDKADLRYTFAHAALERYYESFA